MEQEEQEEEEEEEVEEEEEEEEEEEGAPRVQQLHARPNISSHFRAKCGVDDRGVRDGGDGGEDVSFPLCCLVSLLLQRHQSMWEGGRGEGGADTTGCKLNINPFLI